MKRAAFTLSILLLAACHKTPEPEPDSSRKPAAAPSEKAAANAAPTSSATASPTAGTPNEIAWDAPAAWKKSDEPRPMRKATYRIPHAPGDTDDGDLSVTQVGGTVEQNIKRWSEQFEKKSQTKRSERVVGGLKVTIIELEGDYLGMASPGGGADGKPAWALLGAIVETKVPTFFKLTGPKKTIAAARGDFDRFVDSIHPK
jgi:hypothetical protein